MKSQVCSELQTRLKIVDADCVEDLQRVSLPRLMTAARALRDEAFGNTVTYSPKVFIPLTRLCRDVCSYCTFSRGPRSGQSAYLTPEEVLSIALAGEKAGCTEALFTLGDRPEAKYDVAKDAVAKLGFETTVDYLAAMCQLVLENTKLLPHTNAGVLTAAEIATLRAVSVSQSLMLENVSERLCAPGECHYQSPDKVPSVRLATLDYAGRLGVPITTGVLVGIGETRAELIDSLVAIKELNDRHGHIQEVIIQNFCAKPKTKMASAPEPSFDDLLWSIAAARLVFGAAMNVQAPPNLSPHRYSDLIEAGINDWGGISPITPDHVNPEAAWPHIEELREATARAGKVLVARLPLYPKFALNADRWIDARVSPKLLRAMNTEGYAREDQWQNGESRAVPAWATASAAKRPQATQTWSAVFKASQAIERGRALSGDEIVSLFQARGDAFRNVVQLANSIRSDVNGDAVTYVVNRNINYTNICSYRCQFCAFSKGRGRKNLRGPAYDLDLSEIGRRAKEAWARGATEVCMQGGIHPDYTGETYLSICRAVKDAVPKMHIHAFSPLEIMQGARTLNLTVREFLAALAGAGLGSLPGTAAEILDDGIRKQIAPDKLMTEEWVRVVGTAHDLGLRTTSTIMFGHCESVEHWARHLQVIRELQQRTGGITEFVPLPFVPMEAPMYLKGAARSGPTFREAVLMHAVARITLHPLIKNVQVSWTKLGPEGAKYCLDAGANDLGGTLMNESISRAAGATHGQEFAPAEIDELVRSIGRTPRQRDTLYRSVDDDRQALSYCAEALEPLVQTPPREHRLSGPIG